MAQFWRDPVLSQLPDWAFAEVRDYPKDNSRTCGVVVRSHVRNREIPVFASAEAEEWWHKAMSQA